MSIGNINCGVFNNILKFLNIVFNLLFDLWFVIVNDLGIFNKEFMIMMKLKIVRMIKIIC